MPDDEILVVGYDPRWPEWYEGERSLLEAALAASEARFEHIGSTAVPGLCAKPVIDILVGVRDLGPAEEYAPALRRLRYAPGDSGEPGRHFFMKVPRTAHLHVVRYRSWDWHSKIWFRDALRGDADLRARYSALKTSSALMYRDDREAYSRSKDALVSERLRQECLFRLLTPRAHEQS
jgi:GrpB-like predicted nucleotidyltransferase (UPF0157 family)